MKKTLIIALAVLFCNQYVTAQKTSTVLENGIPVENGDSNKSEHLIPG
jgi:hypothetical protein